MPGILLFGAEGQVGWELQRSLSLHGSVVPLTRAEVSLADAGALRAAIRNVRPEFIVNAAAYTAVDRAETEAELAFAINAAAPAIMAEEARAAGIAMVHYSSDYTYDGNKQGPYLETDATNPQSVYARSKLAGDEAVLASGARAIILRTSWVYGARGANFLRTILRLASERESLRVVSDQVGAPTSAELLADVTAQLLPHLRKESTRADLFHCTAAGATSWHGYATFIVEEALKLKAGFKLAPEKIEAIPTEQYTVPAPRPKNSRLDCTRLQQAFGLPLPHWQLHVRRTLRELLT
ncbi:MAG: hypothetical protein RLZZ227_284 [Pseudomonadota bacterium]|jgi:dTDP-4-dehydrorhamnose reductase